MDLENQLKVKQNEFHATSLKLQNWQDANAAGNAEKANLEAQLEKQIKEVNAQTSSEVSFANCT